MAALLTLRALLWVTREMPCQLLPHQSEPPENRRAELTMKALFSWAV